MRKLTFLRFLLLSIGCALVLGLLTLFALRMFTENSSIEFRRHMALSIAAIVEPGPLKGSIQRFEATHRDSRLLRSKIWVVSASGEVLSSTHDEPLPVSWNDLPKPEEVHDIALSYRFLGVAPALTVLRLATSEPAYIVAANPRGMQTNRRDYVQVFLVGAALAFSALISMLMTFFYLRSKSSEARSILLRMERGDLKARFSIKRFDEMGSLMLDFNRMASEIERLVGRVQEIETARKALFQELSHDLRTPLTSLRTAIDTLDSHWEQMPTPQRTEVISVCKTEIAYFLELLENLLFIAQMDEPHYKKASESVDVVEILEGEIQTRKRLGSLPHLEWEVRIAKNSPRLVSGDSHLIRRLVRNAIENASRYAKKKVTVSIVEKQSQLCLQVLDDGAGMTKQEIDQFGKPRSSRLVERAEDIAHVSLGLGSVIMTKVVELHKGRLSITSDGGTCVEIFLPKN